LVIVAVVAALVAGCTSDPAPTPSPSPSAQQLTVAGAPAGTVVAVDEMAGPQLEGLTRAGPTFSITPGGKLPEAATVTVHLDAAQPSGVLVVIATRQVQDGPWSFVPATLATDRRSASITIDHFSWFAPFTMLLSGLVEAFKSQLAEGLTGGLYQDVPKPKCSQEKQALTDGYSVKSSTSDSVFWCFGIQDGQRVLKLVNHRRYPMMVEHTTKVLDEGSWTRYASLSALSRAFSGKDSVLAPGDTITFSGEIERGTVRGARTSIDGFGQSLVAIQTAAEALLFIFTKLGSKELNNKALLRWMDAATTAGTCLEAFPNPGKVLTKCFDDKALAGLVGAVWAPVAGAVLAGAGVLAFIQGEINMLTDSINGNGRYTVQIKRAAAPSGLSTALPRYPATSDAGDALELFLHKKGITVLEPPIEFGCNLVGVSGANLSKGDVDMTVSTSRCDGDVIVTWYRIRDGRVQSTGWASPEAGVGDTKGLDTFDKPYSGYQGSMFDVAPGESGRFYLYPMQ